MNLRIHPVMLFSRLKKFLFLLLLPVATGMIRFFLTGQFPDILLGFYFFDGNHRFIQMAV